MIQTDTDISFPLLLNLKMTNVKPNWVSSLFCSHILFSKKISFQPQGELWAAACVCASNIVCRSTWWGSGEWRVKSSPSSARQALGPASLGPWHTDFSPTSLLPWPFFFFFLSTVICLSCLLREICIYLQWVSRGYLFLVPTKVQSRLAVNPELGLIHEKDTYQQL